MNECNGSGLMALLMVIAMLCAACGDGKAVTSLSDCEYADRFNTTLGAFANDVAGVEGGADTQALDALDGQLRSILARLNHETPPADLRTHNAGVVAAIDTFRKQLPAVKQAAANGGSGRASAALSQAEGNFSVALAKVQQQNAGPGARLDRCMKK